jgi:hypothetical protein
MEGYIVMGLGNWGYIAMLSNNITHSETYPSHTRKDLLQIFNWKACYQVSYFPPLELGKKTRMLACLLACLHFYFID